jgi:hypothetical protein
LFIIVIFLFFLSLQRWHVIVVILIAFLIGACAGTTAKFGEVNAAEVATWKSSCQLESYTWIGKCSLVDWDAMGRMARTRSRGYVPPPMPGMPSGVHTDQPDGWEK